MTAAERGETGNALLERAKGEGSQDAAAAPLDPQQLEKELLLAREAINCKLIYLYPISSEHVVGYMT